jgi:agmatine deiminase
MKLPVLTFLKSSTGIPFITCRALSHSNTFRSKYVLPADISPHRRTWVAFGADANYLGEDIYQRMQQTWTTMVRNITQFEPVAVLVRPNEKKILLKMLNDAGLSPSIIQARVELVESQLDDIWIRDTGCVFVCDPEHSAVINQNSKSSGTVAAAVGMNFNGWGEKVPYLLDKTVANTMSSHCKLNFLKTSFVSEGGGLEVDGEGTAIVTESCIVNTNRNPGQREIVKKLYEDEVKQLYGIRKVIWLPGIKGREYTDGHVDAYARFVRPGEVIVGYEPRQDHFDHLITIEHIDILRDSFDASGRRLQVHVLPGPFKVRHNDSDVYCCSYVNFYCCNGGLLCPSFGDTDADRFAKEMLQKLFPDRKVVQMDIEPFAECGGGIHCTTMQEPI